MKVTVTGATGGIGSRLVAALQARGDEVTVLSRRPDQARAKLGDVEAHAWDPVRETAPVAALTGRDAEGGEVDPGIACDEQPCPGDTEDGLDGIGQPLVRANDAK